MAIRRQTHTFAFIIILIEVIILHLFPETTDPNSQLKTRNAVDREYPSLIQLRRGEACEKAAGCLKPFKII